MGNVDILLLVLQNASDKELKDQQGWTPLDLAAFYKHDDVIKLLDLGAKVTGFAWMRVGKKKRIEAMLRRINSKVLHLR